MSISTVVLADDHPIVLEGLRTLLETNPDLTVVAEATDGIAALQLVERLKPDVLIADLLMPGLTGLELSRQVHDRVPETQVLILTMYSDEDYLVACLKNGVSGYVLKTSAASEILNALSEISLGRRYLSAALSDRVIEAYIGNVSSLPLSAYDTLTTREREVVQLAAEGKSNAQIADRLSISPRTAETHRGRMMKKLGLRSQTDLIRFAIRRGVLSADE